ncbi:MAG: methyltransferase domain-containing protein [Burkholderiales bacterium]|nr:methyltransferase domain-containing protein [Burkholderiales bacterium]
MPGFLVKYEHIAITGVNSLHIRSLLDRQQFSDPLGRAAALGISSAAWPLFGLLWPSGLRLAALMAQRPVRPGERILELGCGLALASLVSHRRGADVTASDCHPLAGAFLRENLRLNALLALPYRHAHWGAGADVPPPRDEEPVPSGRFDLIIGSDLLYERDEHGGLAAFIQQHAQPSAQVLIIDPDRGNRPAFNRRMAAAGFTLDEQRLPAAAPPAAAYKGRLLSYTRQA